MMVTMEEIMNLKCLVLRNYQTLTLLRILVIATFLSAQLRRFTPAFPFGTQSANGEDRRGRPGEEGERTAGRGGEAEAGGALLAQRSSAGPSP